MAALHVDVTLDFVCPWCLVGEARLRAALARRPELDVAVRYAPFLLDPSVPSAGVELRPWLARRYGQGFEATFRRVEAAAAEAGVPLDFSRVERLSNTRRAHVLVAAAEARGTAGDLVRALFDAYFLDGADIGALDVLTRIGASHGFSRDEVLAVVDDDVASDAVRDRVAAAGRLGVTGVPFFVFQGRYAISGAQPTDTFVQVLDGLVRRRTGP